MTAKVLSVAIALMLWISVAGCSKTPTVEVNGYRCTACAAKFYTTDGTYAQQCPACKNNAIEDVLVYVCPADQQKTVAARTRAGAQCAQCKKVIEAGQYPAEVDLKAWGATEKSKSEVGG